MGIQRVDWAERERIEQGDLQAVGDLGLSNLASVLQSGFQASGVLRGCDLIADGSFTLSLQPGCVIDPNNQFGVIVIDAAQVVGPLDPNDNSLSDNPSSYGRVDLLCIRYVESTTSASRTFIESDASTSDSPTPVRIVSSFELQVVKGAYAGLPVAADTPVGWVALATIFVDFNATGITQEKVHAVTTMRVADPSIWYPRFHYAPALTVGTLPFTHVLFNIPDLPAQIVGYFSLSMSLYVGSIVNPGGEWGIDVQGTGGAGMLVAQAIQTAPEPTAGNKVLHLNVSGTIWPTATASAYHLTLRRYMAGVEIPVANTLGSVAIAYLRATAMFCPTVAPWPGKTVA